jgi:hypothetical protein
MPTLPVQDRPLLKGHWQSAAVQSTTSTTLVKRFDSVGTQSAFGIGITLFVLTLLGIAFYLGRRRERTGTWRLWRSANTDPKNTTSTPLAQLDNNSKSSGFKYTISSPIAVASSAPVELHSPVSPAEAEVRTRYLELPAKEIYEMGIPSPKAKHMSWMSRTAWWKRESLRRKESNAGSEMTRWTNLPPYPEDVHIRDEETQDASSRTSKDSKRSTLMERSEEHVRKVYAQQETDLALKATPWY